MQPLYLDLMSFFAHMQFFFTLDFYGQFVSVQ